jgi:RNA polymerase sigma-70 factor (ECF subfamily)
MEDLGRAFARGRAAHPRLKLTAESFGRHLARSKEARRGRAAKELPIEDLYLACACTAGVKGAAASFEAKYGAIMHRAVARVLGSPAEQEEAIQRARQLLLVGDEGRPPRIATYVGDGPLESWVAVATLRLAVSQGRSETAERRLRERAAVDAMGPDPEMMLLKGEIRREFETAVRAVLNGLEKRARLVLKLYLVGGMSLAAIGKTFGVTQQTVSRWLAETRDGILTGVQLRLADRLKIAREDLPSIVRLVGSQLDISISRLLGTQKT